MKGLIIGIIITLILVTIAVPSMGVHAQTPKPLDHVVISPSTATLPVGATKQFNAVARDSDNVSVSGVSYTWNVIAGGGTISSTGLFTAGNTTGTYTNTVQVTAVKGSITKTAYATVIVVKAEEEEHPFRPHGWSQGKKTGWHNSDTPPGWSHGKKMGWHKKNGPTAWFKIKAGWEDYDDR